MTKYIIYATQTSHYEIEVDADNSQLAYESLNEMIEDDFDQHRTDSRWDFEIEENE